MINTTLISNKILDRKEYFCKSSYTLGLSTKVIRNCKSGPMLRVMRIATDGFDYWLAQQTLLDVVWSCIWTKKYEY